MTRKEFNNHDWKVGDILYESAYRRFDHFVIPSKVIRVEVTNIHDGWFYVSPCNKKNNRLVATFGYPCSLNARYNCSNIFFTKEEADKHFKKEYDEFKAVHALRLHQYLREELKGLDIERQAIYGIMRMNIMQL